MPGTIQPDGKVADLCFGIRRPVQRAADSQASSVPGFATQQASPGIGVAHAGRDEHVAPLQPSPKAFEGREDVGAIVSNAAGIIQCMAFPGRTEKFGWRLSHAGLGPVVHASQVVQRGDDRLAGRRRVERDSPQQGGEQRAHAPPMRAQFLIPPVVGRGDQTIDAGHGGLDVGPSNLFEQGIPPFGDRQRVVPVGYDMLANVAQHDGRGVEIAQRAQPGFAVCLLGMGEDVGCQDIEEFNRIVERRRFQGLEQGSEGSRASWFVQRCQAGRLGDAGATRKPPKRSRGQIGGWRQAQTVAADCIDTFQMAQQLGRRSPLRRRAQIFQRDQCGIIACNQRRQLLPLLVAQGLGQAIPESQRRPMAHAIDQALQCGDAGQRNFVRQQPGSRPVEQQTRTVIPGPAQDIEPAGQPEASRPVLFQITKPVAFADYRGMAPALPAIAVSVQTRRRVSAELARHGRDHHGWHLSRIVKKRAEEARRPELDREPDPVVCATHLSGQIVICGVKVKVASELLFTWVAGVATVPRTLFIGQETARHGVRNSGHSQRSASGPKIRHLRLAKLLCGMAELCDKFRIPAGAAT